MVVTKCTCPFMIYICDSLSVTVLTLLFMANYISSHHGFCLPALVPFVTSHRTGFLSNLFWHTLLSENQNQPESKLRSLRILKKQLRLETFKANLLCLIRLVVQPFLPCHSSVPPPSSSASAHLHPLPLSAPPAAPPGPSCCFSENKTFNYVASSSAKLHHNTQTSILVYIDLTISDARPEGLDR